MVDSSALIGNINFEKASGISIIVIVYAQFTDFY